MFATAEMTPYGDRKLVPLGRLIDHMRPASELHTCPVCSSPLVYPTVWDEVGRGRFELLLRCPNCEAQSIGIFDRAAVERLEGELDRATHELVRDLTQLARRNMEDDVERFIAALRAGAILPMDF